MKIKRVVQACGIMSVFMAWSLLMPLTGFAAVKEGEKLSPGRQLAKQVVKEKEHWITADHSKHEILKGEFTSGPEVTEACIYCHTEASLQFHKTIHWTWMDPRTKDTVKLGKGGLSVNNF